MTEEKKTHREFCPKCSSTRKKSHLKTRSVTGKVFFCFHCGDRGYIDDKGRDINVSQGTAPKTPPMDPAEALTGKLPKKIVEWFGGRGISLETLQRNKIEFEKGYIRFPYFWNGDLVNIKYRSLDKKFHQVPGRDKVFYGLDDIAGQDEIIITEGEIDKLSFYQAEYVNAVSVPDGAPTPNAKAFATKFKFIDNCVHLFRDAKKIILAVDNDAPGLALQQELIRRLDPVKCWKVIWPEGCKDANEVLVKLGIEGLINLIEGAILIPIKGIYAAADFRQEIDADYTGGGLPPGVSTGITGLDHFYTVRESQITVVTGIPSHGKAIALTTDIPTVNGWKTMEELIVGDTLFDEKGAKCKVIGVTPTLYDRECYRISFGDGNSIVADADHQWFTISEKARRSQYGSKKKRGARENTLPRGTDQRHKRTFPGIVTTKEISETLKSGGKNNHQVPLCLPVKHSWKRLPLNPYVFGVWLGDGASTSGLLTTPDIDILERIRRKGVNFTIKSAKFTYGLKGITGQLRDLGVWGNKHIPECYLRASVRQRLELLKGLMDTDGHCAKLDRRCEYSSSRKTLALNVLELVLGLGIKATLIKGRAMLNGLDYGEKYRVCFTTDVKVFHLKRKLRNQSKRVGKVSRYKARTIVNCERVKSEPVRCIEVDSPSKLYLVTKACIPTHNSSFLTAITLNIAKEHGWNFAVFSPENNPVSNFVSRMMSIYVGKPFSKGPGERMSLAEKDNAISWLDSRFKFLMPGDDAQYRVDDILSLAKICVQRYGVKGVIIDPWNEIDHTRGGNLSETEYISQSLTKIRAFSRVYQVHVWIVAHPMKPQKDKASGKYPPPTAYDIQGSSHWRNKADNILCVYRDEMDEVKNVQVHIQKIRFRNIGRPGLVHVRYDSVTGRYDDLTKLEVLAGGKL